MDTKSRRSAGRQAAQPSAPRRQRVANLMGKNLAWIYGLALPAVLCACLYAFEGETLFRIQELSLFLPDATFYHTLSVYPGGTLQWAACFLTQCFFHPALGSAMLWLLWAASFFVARSAFRLRAAWSILAALMPVALLAAIVEMGYFIYYIKLPGHAFAPSLGILLALSATWVGSRLSRRTWMLAVWMTVWTVAGYPLLGAYALAGTGYMAAWLWRKSGSTVFSRAGISALAVLLVVATPLVAWHFYEQTTQSALYTAALPSFDAGGEVFTSYRIPYYMLFALPLAAALTGGVPSAPRKWMTGAIHAALLVAAAWGLKTAWYTDGNFHRELLMARAIEDEDWEQVVDIFRTSVEEPTRLMVMNKNLALFRLGRAGDEMFRYREGGARPSAPFVVRLAHVGGKALYFHYGQENYCYRWCMEDGVVYGWRVEYLKYMTKTSIANGDHKVARKYINLLKQTLFHKRWAEKYETYLDHPERIRESSEFGPVLSLMPETNELSSDQSIIEMYLLRAFAYRDSHDPVCQEQALIAALQMKEIGTFWNRFFHYAQQHVGQRMPRHYQEAAYLYGHLENQVDISHMPFDPEVKDSYNRFMAFSQRCAGMTEAQMAEAFRPLFGHTFYYFYFLTNGLQTY